MAAEIIPIQQGRIRWAAPAVLVGFSADVPACLKAYYVLQCAEYPTGPAEDKAINLLKGSSPYASYLYGNWINQCQMLAGSDRLQREIGATAKKAGSAQHSQMGSAKILVHTSVALREKSENLEEIWWEMNIGDKPRTIRSLFKEFETELLRLA